MKKNANKGNNGKRRMKIKNRSMMIRKVTRIIKTEKKNEKKEENKK